MAKFNDINLKEWKESDIVTDSLWIINNRDNSGKHDGFYHGNFVPQIPRQLIKRYTKKNDIVFDPFVGSGTTIYEAENLDRKYIGIDIQQDLVNYINNKVDNKEFEMIFQGDSTDKATFIKVKECLKKYNRNKIQLAILHPPYADIIKFSDNKNDLSNCKELNEFRNKFKKVLINTINILEDNRYLAIIIGDKYANSEWIPLRILSNGRCKKLWIKIKKHYCKEYDG